MTGWRRGRDSTGGGEDDEDLGAPDATGRQVPQIIEGSNFSVPADLAIKALGFDPEDLPAMLAAPKLGVTRWGTLKIDFRSMPTTMDGVFAAGDIVQIEVKSSPAPASVTRATVEIEYELDI